MSWMSGEKINIAILSRKCRISGRVCVLLLELYYLKGLKLFVIWMKRASWVVEADITYVQSSLLKVGGILSSLLSVQTGVFGDASKPCPQGPFRSSRTLHVLPILACSAIMLLLFCHAGAQRISVRHLRSYLINTLSSIFCFWNIAASLVLYPGCRFTFLYLGNLCRIAFCLDGDKAIGKKAHWGKLLIF